MHVQNHAYANKSRRTYERDVRQLSNPQSPTFKKSIVFSRHYNTFSRDNKFISQTPLKITDETLPRCLFTIVMQARKSGPSKTTLKEVKQRRFVSFQTIPCSYDYALNYYMQIRTILR